MNRMVTSTIVVGTLLLVLGVGTYAMLATTSETAPSPTALIPALAGFPILVLGVLSQRYSYRHSTLRIAWWIALIGFLMPVGRLASQLAQGSAPSVSAATSLILMAVLCGFLVVCGYLWSAASKQTS